MTDPSHDAILARRRERAAAVRRGDLAEEMTVRALELACVVRDEDADGIARWLEGVREHERTALLVALAALVPVDRPASELLAWVSWDEYGRSLKPPGCGTPEAYRRHKRLGELIDDDCREAMRAVWNAQNRARAAAGDAGQRGDGDERAA